MEEGSELLLCPTAYAGPPNPDKSNPDFAVGSSSTQSPRNQLSPPDFTQQGSRVLHQGRLMKKDYTGFYHRIREVPRISTPTQNGCPIISHPSLIGWLSSEQFNPSAWHVHTIHLWYAESPRLYPTKPIVLYPNPHPAVCISKEPVLIQGLNSSRNVI